MGQSESVLLNPGLSFQTYAPTISDGGLHVFLVKVGAPVTLPELQGQIIRVDGTIRYCSSARLVGQAPDYDPADERILQPGECLELSCGAS